MICSVAADDDGDAPDRRGAYGFDGVAMLTALADQRGPPLSVCAQCSATSKDADIEWPSECYT
jgi:hypothetical protein